MCFSSSHSRDIISCDRDHHKLHYFFTFSHCVTSVCIQTHRTLHISVNLQQKHKNETAPNPKYITILNDTNINKMTLTQKIYLDKHVFFIAISGEGKGREKTIKVWDKEMDL